VKEEREMLKVIIVDDEKLVRQMILRCISWHELGLEIVGEASGAREGLELMELHQPDIIITDVRMPRIDGLDFGRKVLKRYPKIKVVILSGHDEFEYASEALKMGVFDYLLKPVNREEMKAAMEKARDTILKEKEFDEEIENLRGRLRDSSLSAKEGFDDKDKTLVDVVKEYIEGHFSEEDISLASVSEMLYVNASYLSRTFKEKAGKSFSEYLFELRMEKAMSLLQRLDLKAYEIADRVGIKDPHYFSTCFKKYTGISVSEFKKEN